MEDVVKSIIKCTTLLAVVGFSSWSPASPRPLPYTYPYETLGEGELELELYGDFTLLRVADAAGGAEGRVSEPAYVLQNEFEFGVSDRIELDFYQTISAQPLAGGA